MEKDLEDGDRGALASRVIGSSDGKAGAGESEMGAADDLRALLSRAALSESQYREFSSPIRTSVEIPLESVTENRVPAVSKSESHPETVVNMVPSRVLETATTSLIRPNEGGTTTRPKPQPAEPSRNNGKKSDSTLESRWSVLGRALSGETDDSPSHLIHGLANSVSVPFSFISSISGGTGVTTILATLARCFAAEGERVLLAGTSIVSLFPLYFGSSNPGTGELQHFSIGSSGGRVDTVNRSEPEDPASEARSSGESGSLISKIRVATVASDRLLLDSGTLNTGDAEILHSTKQFGLVPLVPDLSCVFGLLRLEQALRPQGTKTNQPNTVFYVLNKFDDSLALHRDIKASLEKLLSDRLLPITLRRSDAVAEALADGMTVIDYCPETAIAQDFIRLANWIRERFPAARRKRSE